MPPLSHIFILDTISSNRTCKADSPMVNCRIQLYSSVWVQSSVSLFSHSHWVVCVLTDGGVKEGFSRRESMFFPCLQLYDVQSRISGLKLISIGVHLSGVQSQVIWPLCCGLTYPQLQYVAIFDMPQYMTSKIPMRTFRNLLCIKHNMNEPQLTRFFFFFL